MVSTVEVGVVSRWLSLRICCFPLTFIHTPVCSCYTQGVLSKLEHARTCIGAAVFDPQYLAEVDESLQELGALCDSKTLKSRFRKAARRMIMQKKWKEAAREKSRNGETLRKTFQRAIRKARVSAAFTPKEAMTGVLPKLPAMTRVLSNRSGNEVLASGFGQEALVNDGSEAEVLGKHSCKEHRGADINPVEVIHQIEESAQNFYKSSAARKRTATEELLWLTRTDSEESQHSLPDTTRQQSWHPRLSEQLDEDMVSRQVSVRRQQEHPTIQSPYDLQELEVSGVTPAHSIRQNRESLANKRDVVRSVMLEMHLQQFYARTSLQAFENPSQADVNQLGKPKRPPLPHLPRSLPPASPGSPASPTSPFRVGVPPSEAEITSQYSSTFGPGSCPSRAKLPELPPSGLPGPRPALSAREAQGFPNPSSPSSPSHIPSTPYPSPTPPSNPKGRRLAQRARGVARLSPLFQGEFPAKGAGRREQTSNEQQLINQKDLKDPEGVTHQDSTSPKSSPRWSEAIRSSLELSSPV